jgi:predicted MFS family arabinose efflux permease
VTSPGEQRKKPAPAARALTILFLVNALNIYDRQALGAVLEPLRHEFHLNDAQLGALPTFFTVVYAIAGLPLGRLADHVSRKRLLALGIAVWAGLTGLGGAAVNYGMLLATRLGVGIGEAVCAPVAVSWIGDLVSESRRARAMAGFMLAVPAGVMLSFAVSGPVAQAHGWRIAMAIAALPAVILIPAVLGLREPVRPETSRPERNGAFRDLVRIPALWWIAVSGAILNFTLYAFSTFISAFLTRVHGMPVGPAGLWSGIGSGVAGMLGALAAGAWGDRGPGPWKARLAAAAALVAAPVGVVALRIPPGRAAAAVFLLMAAYGLLQMYYALIYAAIQDLVEPGMRGAAMAGYFLIMYLGGGAFGPLLTGTLSDFFAHGTSEAARAHGLHQAMYVIPLFSALLAATLWKASSAMRRAASVTG